MRKGSEDQEIRITKKKKIDSDFEKEVLLQMVEEEQEEQKEIKKEAVLEDNKEKEQRGHSQKYGNFKIPVVSKRKESKKQQDLGNSMLTSMLATPIINIENFDLRKSEFAEQMKMGRSMSFYNPSFVAQQDLTLYNMMELKKKAQVAQEERKKKANRPVQEIKVEFAAPLKKETEEGSEVKKEEEKKKEDESVKIGESMEESKSQSQDPMSAILKARKNAKEQHFQTIGLYNKKIEDYFQNSLKRQEKREGSQTSQQLQNRVQQSQEQGKECSLSTKEEHFSFSMKVRSTALDQKPTPSKSINSSLLQRTSQKSVRSKKERKKVQKRHKGLKNSTLDRFFFSGKRTISEEGGNSSDTDSKHSTLLFVRQGTGLATGTDNSKHPRILGEQT